MRFIYSQDRHKLFKYINCKTGAGTKSIRYCKNDVAVTDQEAAEVLLQTFTSNFSIRHTAKPCSTSAHMQSFTDFACMPAALIVEALHRCPNSNSCPDGLLLPRQSSLLLPSFSSILSSRGYFHLFGKRQ